MKALRGKTNAPNRGRERDEEETENEKEEDGDEGEKGRLKREEKVSTSQATFIPFTSLPVRAIDEERREGHEEDEEGREEEEAEHMKVKPLRFTGDFMA